MTVHGSRFQNPETGEWHDDRRVHPQSLRDEAAHRRIDSLSESLDGKLTALANSIKLWLVLTIGGAIAGVVIAFVLPLSDKIYAQGTIDTAQNERILVNSAAITALRTQAEIHRAELQAMVERRFDANEKRLDRQDEKLDKILERTTAFNDPKDRRGIILPKEEELR